MSYSFQKHVRFWVEACFGHQNADDYRERCDRFMEEAIELLQACQYKKEDAQRILDYVYSRPQGAIEQEVGGTLITLSALCSALKIDMDSAGAKELKLCESRMSEIRIKNANKPRS